jgi:hypothetical protein
MKRFLVLLSFGVLLAARPAAAQTANTHFQIGTNSLAQQTMSGLTSAHNSFLSAVAADSNHANGNALLAITRLLILVSQTPGSDFLTDLGFPLPGRDIYAWNSAVPEDGNGFIAPTGVGAQAIPAHFRTNVVAQLKAAEGNLAKVTSPTFLLTLGEDVTTLGTVTLDRGDVLMIRAILHFWEYFFYTLNAQNLDAQLTALRNLDINGNLTAERLLADYPSLFTFATTADLNSAKTAFQNFRDRYNEASTFIRGRISQEDRLFMYDDEDDGMVDMEFNFRRVIDDLNTSLASGATVLQTDDSLAVNAQRHFDGSRSIRSLLPQFSRDRFVIGTLPDATFGGLITGLDVNDVEEGMLEFVDGALRILPVGAPINNEVTISFTAIAGLNYEVLGTEDFVNWQMLTSFEAETRNVAFNLPISGQRGFLRIVSQDMDSGGGTYYSVLFDPALSVTACNGGTPLNFSSQTIPPPDGAGNFSTTWSPSTPVINVNGNIGATTFSANVTCSSGGAFLTGLSATRFGQYFQGNQGTGRFYVTDQNDKVYLQGRVMNGSNPVSGLTVSTSLDSNTATTDGDGYFFLVTATAANFSSTPYTVTVKQGANTLFSSNTVWGDHPAQLRIQVTP